MIYTTLLLTALVETVRGHGRLISDTASVGIQNLLKEIEAEGGSAEEPLGELTVARRRQTFPREWEWALADCGARWKMDCKEDCPPGWSEVYRTGYGCCASMWDCFGTRKVCQKRCGNEAIAREKLSLSICGSTTVNAGQTLIDIANELKSKWNSGYNKCDAMKALVLPHLRACMLRNEEKPMTLYAGFTFDGSVIVKGAKAVGAYLDSTGKTGCFNTNCIGAGLNFGAGVGVVAGVLFGDGTNDFPGVGYGFEVGGDFGPGADFAAGATTSNVPYVEVTVGSGVGVAAGYNACNTDTELASQGTFFPEAPGPIEGGFSGAGRR